MARRSSLFAEVARHFCADGPVEFSMFVAALVKGAREEAGTRRSGQAGSLRLS